MVHASYCAIRLDHCILCGATSKGQQTDQRSELIHRRIRNYFVR